MMNQFVEISKVFDVYPDVIVILAKNPKGDEYRLPIHIDPAINFNDIRENIHFGSIVGLKGYIVHNYGETICYATKISILK